MQIENLSRKLIIERSLAKSIVVIAPDLKSCFDISNLYAPEHLMLQINASENYIEWVRNAGSVFWGAWTPGAVGDCASGTNHVLPTVCACVYSGMGVETFMKSITFQQLTLEGLFEIGSVVALHWKASLLISDR
ncbi:hypothetical protein BCY86_08620 [Pajaroellobacter abortibovis]|uniref:Histidinol dehydrogenase n=1 Tax=Pajaroellobacter abortibovis TaxID=1882918 RepID=A0A1L6MYW6_9BACT|nr:hypothetical protein BCY86_08620 [Pajaroellobacter abortibovis]